MKETPTQHIENQSHASTPQQTHVLSQTENNVFEECGGSEDLSESSVESEDQPECDEEDPKIRDVVRAPLIRKTVFRNTTFELYVCDARTLFRLVDNWSFNRSVRDHHVQSIYNDLKNMRHPHLLGTIKIVRNPEKEHRIIDGQHRLLAIRQILEEDEAMTWNMDVVVEMYEVDDIKYGSEVFDLYIKANRNMNMDPEDSLDMEIINIVNGMCQDKILSMGIVDKQDGSVYRPRISKKDLYEQFKDHYKPLEKIKVEHIVHKVKEINRKLGLVSHRNMFGERSVQRVSHQKRKADELKFYLNMAESKYPPKIWIPFIYKGTSILETIVP